MMSRVCLLIVLRGMHADYPLVVASNRDEHRDRKASPPGLFVGEHHRMISPRDRLAGGTWIGVNDKCMFAGLTNIAGVPAVPGAPSRGHLPHLALDQDDVGQAAAAVLAAVLAHPYSGFQLVVADAQEICILRHAHGAIQRISWLDPVLVVSNEHAPGQLELADLPRALGTFRTVHSRLDALRPLLLDRGGEGRHAVLKCGEDYGTVSSSLCAVPATDPSGLVWRYAAGAPDVNEYRNYGNLGRRLLPESEHLPSDLPRADR
jgi:uncharacterized protein with NRDE domain